MKKQKSGLYRTKLKIGVDENGKDIVKWISGKTKRELEDNKRQARAFYIEGDQSYQDRIFGEHVREWFREYKAPRVESVTLENYRTLLNVHILPEFGERQMRAISAVDIQKWFNGYTGMSESTINKLYSLITAIFRDALAGGVLIRDVTAALKKPKAKKPSKKGANK